MKPLFRRRTFWAFVVGGASAVVELADLLRDNELLPPKWRAALGLVAAICGVLLVRQDRARGGRRP